MLALPCVHFSGVEIAVRIDGQRMEPMELAGLAAGSADAVFEQGLVEQVAQFGLAHQDKGEEFFPLRLEIREQPQLLEHVRLEVLSFIDQHHRPASSDPR